MQNQCERQVFAALSNGALGFPVSPVLYAENGVWVQNQFQWICLSSFIYTQY